MNNKVQLVPIPWMKQKLESIYEENIYGNLYLMFNNLYSKSYINTIDSNTLIELLSSCNISIDETYQLYLYLPVEIDNFLKDLIISFKSLFNEKVYIIIGGYKEYNKDLNELDCVANIYTKFPILKNSIYSSYLIDTSKCYEIFTSLSDTHGIYINPIYSCTISGPTLNYHIKQKNPNNVTHISFVNLLEESLYDNYFDYYLKGLNNNNNNFNFNY